MSSGRDPHYFPLGIPRSERKTMARDELEDEVTELVKDWIPFFPGMEEEFRSVLRVALKKARNRAKAEITVREKKRNVRTTPDKR